MSGMRKAMRRRARNNYELGEGVFRTGDVLGAGLCSDQADGTPGLMLILLEGREEYEALLEKTQRFEICFGRGAFALDALLPNGERRRVMTEVPGQFLPMLGYGAPEEIQLFLADADDSTGFRRPATLRCVDAARLCKEPVEVGEGSHVVKTVNVWDGTVSLHRFRSREEAEEQLVRNMEEDRPFAGLAVD